MKCKANLCGALIVLFGAALTISSAGCTTTTREKQKDPYAKQSNITDREAPKRYRLAPSEQ